MRSIQRIAKAINESVKRGDVVMVDKHRVRAARIREGELEIDWWRNEAESFWTAIEPNFMNHADGNLIIETSY